MSVETHLGLLGMRVEDRVTGLTGVVTAISFDLYGCVQAIIHPGLDSDGKLKEVNWFDVGRLRVKSVEPVMQRPDFGWTPEAIAKGEKGPGERPASNKA